VEIVVPHHVYGPVPSRRLGRSLGIDLVPFKTCSYDCIYCQLGRTTRKTIARREYVPLDAVVEQVARSLRDGAAPDFIGIAGSGEPTLHSGIGDLIARIKALTPVAVLTNGSLLWMPEVCAALARADVVMPSLDAGRPRTFERVNRPHPDITFERMVDGLLSFAQGFGGEIWLEVFVLDGITDRREEIVPVAEIARSLRRARVQLNTVSRPPAEDEAQAVSAESLERLRGFFGSGCEIIAEAARSGRRARDAGAAAEEEIDTLLARRPCTVEGIATGLGLAPNDVVKRLDALVRKGTVLAVRRGEAVFYERARAR
jgi:wyosine [tRNA(Phe)-imidazoG37] synthetase (radical SAM superfamily)